MDQCSDGADTCCRFQRNVAPCDGAKRAGRTSPSVSTRMLLQTPSEHDEDGAKTVLRWTVEGNYWVGTSEVAQAQETPAITVLARGRVRYLRDR